ncbi:unnamed protein product [Arctogadus glacialis]
MCESELNSQQNEKKIFILYILALHIFFFFFFIPPDSFIENIISLIHTYIITDHSNQSPFPNDSPDPYPSPHPWNTPCSPLAAQVLRAVDRRPQWPVVGPSEPSIKKKKQLQHREKEEKEKTKKIFCTKCLGHLTITQKSLVHLYYSLKYIKLCSTPEPPTPSLSADTVFSLFFSPRCHPTPWLTKSNTLFAAQFAFPIHTAFCFFLSHLVAISKSEPKNRAVRGDESQHRNQMHWWIFVKKKKNAINRKQKDSGGRRRLRAIQTMYEQPVGGKHLKEDPTLAN